MVIRLVEKLDTTLISMRLQELGQECGSQHEVVAHPVIVYNFDASITKYTITKFYTMI